MKTKHFNIGNSPTSLAPDLMEGEAAVGRPGDFPFVLLIFKEIDDKKLRKRRASL